MILGHDGQQHSSVPTGHLVQARGLAPAGRTMHVCKGVTGLKGVLSFMSVLSEMSMKKNLNSTNTNSIIYLAIWQVLL